jgi:hypothetical protein
VVLNAFPTLGLTCCGAASERALRTRFWFLVAGGPAITAALVVLLWPPASSPWQVVLPLEAFAHRIAPRELLVFFNLWLLAFNLLPVPLLVRSLGMVNDGTRLLTIPFSRQDEARDLLDSAALLRTARTSPAPWCWAARGWATAKMQHAGSPAPRRTTRTAPSSARPAPRSPLPSRLPPARPRAPEHCRARRELRVHCPSSSSVG